MITAVDTNVLIDVFRGDPKFGPRSRAALRECIRVGALVASDVVWAETSAAFASANAATEALERLGVRLVPLDAQASGVAGHAWRSYRKAGGPRHRIVADFLVAAHASVHADRLLTRDHDLPRARFPKLQIVDPSA